jgi:hypothetical protein
MLWLILKPSPVPSALVEKKGSKMWLRTSHGIPGPVSEMRTATHSSGVEVVITVKVPPSGIASTALMIRLRKT